MAENQSRKFITIVNFKKCLIWDSGSNIPTAAYMEWENNSF